ncbi:hypothetical protein PR048_017302 [Dryococelus australis]|uniref:Uncharacterized protein n=1 Tax=Dryococelus australis TaxID=614101 RepID=A0ABQ9H952_9NEOP|nr:hypothetical protein PR048_017302 [Dryococelus australis]
MIECLMTSRLSDDDVRFQMVMDLTHMGLMCDNPNVRGKELENFHCKYAMLSPGELESAFQVTFQELMQVLSQTVPCVGCRRRIEVCSGKGTEEPGVMAFLKRLLDSYFDMGFTVYMDRYCSSPAVFNDLWERKREAETLALSEMDPLQWMLLCALCKGQSLKPNQMSLITTYTKLGLKNVPNDSLLSVQKNAIEMLGNAFVGEGNKEQQISSLPSPSTDKTEDTFQEKYQPLKKRQAQHMFVKQRMDTPRQIVLFTGRATKVMNRDHPSTPVHCQMAPLVRCQDMNLDPVPATDVTRQEDLYHVHPLFDSDQCALTRV